MKVGGRRTFAAWAAIAVLLSTSVCWATTRFLRRQLSYPRVAAEFEERWEGLTALFGDADVSFPPQEVFLRIIKRERVIELWARDDVAEPFNQITTYPVCYYSGTYGPKRREGDLQTPEGFYHVSRFNPRSRHHLSLEVSYPNESDDVLSDPEEPGGNIMIHGGCTSLGCIAITDEQVAELYLIVVAARAEGQIEVPIHIFPARLNDEGLAWLREMTWDPQVWTFWEQLAVGWQFFEDTHFLPSFEVTEGGAYVFSSE